MSRLPAPVGFDRLSEPCDCFMGIVDFHDELFEALVFIGAIAHRLCHLIWKILHEVIRYEEHGPAVSEEAKNVRSRKMIPGMPNSRLQRSTAFGSIGQPGMIASDFRPWVRTIAFRTIA
jgi:hypothetical protein